MSNQSDPVPGNPPTIPDDLTSSIPKPRLRGNMYERAEQRYFAELAAVQTAVATVAPEDVTPPQPQEPPVAEQAITPAVTVAPIEDVPRTVPDAVELDVFATEEAPAPAGLPVAFNVTPLDAPRTVDAAVIARAVASRQAMGPLIVMAAILLVGAAAATFAIRTALQAPEQDLTPVTAQDATAPTAPAPQPLPPPAATAAAVTIPATEPAIATTEPAAAKTAPIARPAATAREVSRTVADTPRRAVATAGQLRITSTPAGARVTVNGIGWGQTPLTIPALPFGTKTVRLTRDGYVSTERSVSLSGGDPSATLNVTMQKR